MGIGRWKDQFRQLGQDAAESLRFGKRNRKAIRQLKQTILDEFQRRDVWALRDAEVQRLAAGRKIWAIKCPAPDNEKKYEWGDYAYCLSLKAVLERLGYYVILNCHEDWYEPVQADVVLVMRGRYAYHPDRRNEKCTYLMWMVCHPDMVPDEEYELYDHVYVDSIPLAEKLNARLNVPVSGMIVGADVRDFHPASSADSFAETGETGETEETGRAGGNGSPVNPSGEDKPLKYGLIFVGNTRGEKRNCVAWCEKYGIPLEVWGNGWEKFYPRDTRYLHFHGQAQYADLPELYRNSAVILNDHFQAMRESGMVNNRMIEASACGCPIVSDYSPEYEKLPGSISFYHGEKDFQEAVTSALEHAAERRRQAEASIPQLRDGYSMDACIGRMITELDL